MNPNSDNTELTQLEKIKASYSDEELVKKCGKYFGAHCDINDTEHLRVARNKVFELEYTSAGVKRSRQLIRKMSHKFKASIKKKPIKKQ